MKSNTTDAIVLTVLLQFSECATDDTGGCRKVRCVVGEGSSDMWAKLVVAALMSIPFCNAPST